MSEPASVVLLYVPCGSEQEAMSIGRALLERRLIACANIYPSRSLYYWEGRIADEAEHVLICKTDRSRAGAARKQVLALHSYELPCVIQIEPTDVNPEYAKWVMAEVAAGTPRGQGGNQPAQG